MDTNAEKGYILLFCKIVAFSLCVTFFFIAPYGWYWLFDSGDTRMHEAVRQQTSPDNANGQIPPPLVLYGPALPYDHGAYALELYKTVKPAVALIGSQRVSNMRSTYMTESFVNMGGSVQSMQEMRELFYKMLESHKPQVLLLALDFWWFDSHAPVPTKPAPPSFWESVKKPWAWLFTGGISLGDFFAPLTGQFENTMFGFFAQKSRTGYAADGSYYPTHILSGQSFPPDFQFQHSLAAAQRGSSGTVSEAQLQMLMEIYFYASARDIQVVLFLPPMAPQIYAIYKEQATPLVFNLAARITEKHMPVIDLSNPDTVESHECEFIDGFTGGDVLGARVFYRLADHFPNFLHFVNVALAQDHIQARQGYASIGDSRLAVFPEIDFMQFSCPTRR